MPVKRPARRLGPGRLSAEDAAQLPDRLLDAAFQLFTERGFSETTMDQIAKRAGASTKTLYSRYENKADILAAVVRRLVDSTIASHDEVAALQALAGNPKGFLVSLCTQISVRISTDAAGLNRLAVAEGHRFSELRRLHREATGRGVGIIRANLERWRAKGWLPLLQETERASVLCLSMATDWVRISTSLGDPPSRMEIDAHVAYAVDLFLRGCGYAGQTEVVEAPSESMTAA
jgi:AcrR family transcriptional regulator